MRRNSSSLRFVLTLFLLSGLFFGAAGESLAREESVPKAQGTTETPSMQADLAVSMLPANPATPDVGANVTFTVRVKNLGPDIATGVTVSDVIPDGLNYKSDDGRGTYNPNTGIWTVGSIGNGGTAQIKITVVVMSSATMKNVASILHSDANDPDPSNNSAEVVLNPVTADLSILQIVDNSAPNKDDQIRFTLTVENKGPSSATNVTVKDLLPVGLVYITDSDNRTTYNPTTGIWAVGTLLASGTGSSDTLTITARVTTAEVKTNVAEVWTSDQYDPNSTPGNGVSSEDDYYSVVVGAKSADLSLTKTIDNPSPNLGDVVEFAITVKNDGPDTATGVTVKDLLSADFNYQSHSGGTYDKNTGIWTIGLLAKDATANLTIRAQTEVDGATTNWAEVWTSDQFDPDSTPGDNSKTTDDDDGVPAADLSIVKSVNTPTVNVGSNAVFTITISNAGPAKATNVVVKDLLPSGLSYVRHTGGTYDNSSGMWTVGALASGTTATLRITARADTAGIISNLAEVWTSNQIDPDSTPGDGSTNTDDDASVSVTVSFPSMTVLINEVAWAGTASTYSGDEWIELYNPTTADINLSGWKLQSVDGSPSINLSGTIPAGGYFLLENKTDDLSVSDIPADLIYSGTLSNSGESLMLYDASNKVVDTANGSGGWPAGSSSTYGSMERKGVVTDSRSSWSTNTGVKQNGLNRGGGAILGTPKQSNTPPPLPTAVPNPVPVKSVVISEVAWMGTQANSSHEWIELFNTTRETIPLDGWRLVSFRWSGTQFVKNLDIALKGKISPRTSTLQNDTSGYFLLVANEDAVSFIGTSVTYDQKYSGSLYNTGEILLLCSDYNITVAKNCDENHKTLLVDFVNARSRTGTIRPWPAGSSSIYGSMERQDWRSDDVTAYFTHTGANPHFGMDANGNFIKGTPKYPNWAFTVTSTPRPTALPTRTATPKPGSPPVLVLNEVMARAGTDWNADGRVDVYDEFIEVINAGTSNLSLSSYKLSLASAPAAVFSLPSQTLKPGERMVFYGSQSGLQLKDSGDTVRLLRASNNSLVDAVAYPIAKVLDASVCRYADGYGSWIVGCYPTPGLANALTGGRFPLPVGGQPVCHLPDSTPRGFVLAECEETGGSGMWNPAYWDSFPGEGQEVWISDPHNKWLAVYQ